MMKVKELLNLRINGHSEHILSVPWRDLACKFLLVCSIPYLLYRPLLTLPIKSHDSVGSTLSMQTITPHTF